MQRMFKLFLVPAIFLFFVASIFAQGSYKVESAPAPTGSDVPKALLDSLDARGARVVSDAGPVCEIWLRKGMALGQAAGGLGDVMYGQLGVGNLIGVLHFPAQGADFRGQPMKPGFYALRYAQIPQDGAHMGNYPTRDTVLMTPAAADTQIDQTLSFQDMVKLSKQASGAPHPAFLVMSAVSDGAAFPSVAKDDQGHQNVQLKVQGKNGELPIGITVVGKWEGA